MKLKNIIALFIVSFLFACVSENNQSTSSSNQIESSSNQLQSKETLQMIQELYNLAENADPRAYCHMNNKRADWLHKRIKIGDIQEQMNTWYEYCIEMLNAGRTKECIDELETCYLFKKGSYEENLTKDNKLLFELLALTYLRFGEEENCRNNHSVESCIIPIQEGGQHQLEAGSRKAIELYTLLQSKFPSPKYIWLLNVAYMTIGDYPLGVPSHLLLDIPSKYEQTDFPAFRDVAMNVGVAQNGLSGGVCIEDFNGDGDLDIFTTSYGMKDNVHLFLNNSDGGYFDATESAGLKGIVSGLNCVHSDYNNDGFIDIFVLRGAWHGKAGIHPNSLLKNNGDGTFQDVTRSAGLLSYHPTQTASWADYDKDGFLDLFIGNESSINNRHPSELYRNNGDGTFKEVAKEIGLGDAVAFVKGTSWGDIDNDGWIDLYLSVMGGKNKLFKNNQGNFEEITEVAGVEGPFYSFPCWFWDVNNDGFQDLLVNGYNLALGDKVAEECAKELLGEKTISEKPKLYINNGDGTFSDQAEEYGISKVMYAMGSNFDDIDNDGFLDFYVGTGSPDFTSIIPNRMFRNVNGTRFEEVTFASGLGHIQKGHGVAFADLDKDGDLDLYAVMGGAVEGDQFTNVLFENPISNNNWIVIELEGDKTNKSGIGVNLELVLDNGRKIYRTVSTGGSFGASSLQQEIGLGKSKKIERLTVYWTNSKPTILTDIEVNQKFLIQEKSGVKVIDYVYKEFKNDFMKDIHK